MNSFFRFSKGKRGMNKKWMKPWLMLGCFSSASLCFFLSSQNKYSGTRKLYCINEIIKANEIHKSSKDKQRFIDVGKILSQFRIDYPEEQIGVKIKKMKKNKKYNLSADYLSCYQELSRQLQLILDNEVTQSSSSKGILAILKSFFKNKITPKFKIQWGRGRKTNMDLKQQKIQQILENLIFINNGVIFSQERRNTLLMDNEFINLMSKLLQQTEEIQKLYPRGKIYWGSFNVEEGVTRIFAILSYTNSGDLDKIKTNPNFNIIEQKMKIWSDQKEYSLRKANSQKYFYHTHQKNKPNKIIYEDSLLPITLHKKYIQEGSFDYDILFIPGHQSHPLYCWRVLYPDDEKEKYKHIFYPQEIWIDKYLEPALEKKKPRILLINYETFQTKSSHKMKNIPNVSFGELSDTIFKSLKHADVGSRPLIIVGYSLGGIIAKQILIQAKEDKDMQRLVQNCKGVIFISCPHHGSTILFESFYNFRNIIPATNLTDPNAILAVGHYEFLETFYNNLPTSKVTKYISDDYEKVEKLHQKYQELKLNSFCFTEGLPMDIVKTGNKNIVVNPENANLCLGVGSSFSDLPICYSHHFPNKNHSQMQRVLNEEDESFQEIKKIIEKIF